jgi:hypothetical protein
MATIIKIVAIILVAIVLIAAFIIIWTLSIAFISKDDVNSLGESPENLKEENDEYKYEYRPLGKGYQPRSAPQNVKPPEGGTAEMELDIQINELKKRYKEVSLKLEKKLNDSKNKRNVKGGN